ncbi:hypothetical protein LF1_13420 [Rubripirellula obstinata]|uniref:Uncharacterized protein n=1 Tax=Rubripirellula obstinata TaxID=406547 RepID=A0A5B1CCB3_9BACT|nr:hypothetical protein LF1_13420 [Rubripirellula obstinata]
MENLGCITDCLRSVKIKSSLMRRIEDARIPLVSISRISHFPLTITEVARDLPAADPARVQSSLIDPRS